MAALALAACGSTPSPLDHNNGTELNPAMLPDSNTVPGEFYEVEVDGMRCIVWINQYGQGQSRDSTSGLSCDWGTDGS